MAEVIEMCASCDERPATEIDGLYCAECFRRVCDEYAAEAELHENIAIVDAERRNSMGADGCPHDDGNLPVAHVNPHPSPYCCCLACWAEWPSQDVTRPEILEPRISMFHCGTQVCDWSGHNCDRCAKGYHHNADQWRCDLEQAIAEGFWTDGTVSNEQARRMGYPFGQHAYGWRCGEFMQMPEVRHV
jgi:hypothetical protein